MVSIIPNFSLSNDDDTPDGCLSCIGGLYGPFRANFQIDVPLWLALALHKRKKCRIQPPEWLTAEPLRETIQQERQTGKGWQPLPYYYAEVAQLLLDQAKDAFEDVAEVKHLLESVRKVRYQKLEAGLRMLDRAYPGVKLNNLGANECNMARLLLRSTLNTFQQLQKGALAAAQAGNGGTQGH